MRPPTPGTLSGAVRDESGAAVNAFVTISTNGFEQRAITRPDGTFQFLNLRPARYFLCAKPLPLRERPGDDPYVDSCLWQDDKTPLVTVPSGQDVRNVTLPVRHGYLLKVRVNDPTRKLAAAERNPNFDPREQVLIHVKAPAGLAQSVPLTKLDLNAREHTLIVPFDTQHQVTVHSRAFVLKDTANRDLDPSRPLPSAASRGQQRPPDIVVNVDRAKP